LIRPTWEEEAFYEPGMVFYRAKSYGIDTRPYKQDCRQSYQRQQKSWESLPDVFLLWLVMRVNT
jgi:hypothetical protein